MAYKRQLETCLHDGRARVLQRVFEAVHTAIRSVAVTREAILGIGVAHSGVIDTEKGLVLSYPPARSDGGVEECAAEEHLRARVRVAMRVRR